MGGSVILSTPLLWVLFGLALILCLFDRSNRATGGTFTVISAFLTVIGCAAALVLGAGMGEVLTALLVFLLLGLEGWK